MPLTSVAAKLLLASALFSPGTSSPRANTRVTAPAEFSALVARMTRRVPSFSRQTKLSCTMCHNGFPQLTPFGRMFKLNGYTLTGLETISEQADSASRKTLELSPIAPISLMAIISNTTVGKAIEGAQASTTQFPQELSLFAASEISTRGGIFAQFTYEDQAGTFAVDNVDLRFANNGKFLGKDVLYGVTLHNNPTVQDVWNTLPGWGYPFTGSGIAPAPAAGTLIDGVLGQSVLGVGGYALFNNALYAELTGYTPAPQGVALPLDSSAKHTPSGLSPYWRLALQHTFGKSYVMVGTFGLVSRIYPSGIMGNTNEYRDYGLDAQIEQTLSKGMLIGRASYTKEDQDLGASFNAGASTNPTNSLQSYKLNVSYLPTPLTTFSAGLFGTTGTRDETLYPAESVTGSATGKPDSQGAILEWTHTPWLNTRFGAQYVMYSKFNGGSTGYDIGAGGRNASHNNTLYTYLWFAY